MNNSPALKLAGLALIFGTALIGCKGSSEQSSAVPSGVPGQAMLGGREGSSANTGAGQTGGSTSDTLTASPAKRETSTQYGPGTSNQGSSTGTTGGGTAGSGAAGAGTTSAGAIGAGNAGSSAAPSATNGISGGGANSASGAATSGGGINNAPGMAAGADDRSGSTTQSTQPVR